MSVLTNLSPALVWNYFEEICKIPRPSKKEEKIIEYLVDFGKKHGLETKKDAAGNVLITKPATPGMEQVKTVVLQSHVDMVCEKNSDTVFNFDTDPIQPVIDGDWVRANGTTLGADNGIGVAAQLALLASNNLKHGKIECLFTVDEETGLTGAFALEPNFFEGEILLNLDSEEDGEFFIGCAGGIDTTVYFPLATESCPKGVLAYQVKISGLKGGHSGDDINKGLGNANKILNRILWTANLDYQARISHIDGGNLRNAIAREAYAIIVVPERNKLENFISKFTADVKAEYAITEPELNISFTSADLPPKVLTQKLQDELIYSVYACPHGVIAMSQTIPGLVETSTNLASIKFKEKEIVVTTSQRSSINSAKKDIANMVESVFCLTSAKAEHGDGYPGWTPNPNSEILKVCQASFKKLFNSEAEVKAIHAGLECGLFLEKYPKLDMVSFGPTLRFVHSPTEKIHIPAVTRFWDLLVDILANVPKK